MSHPLAGVGRIAAVLVAVFAPSLGLAQPPAPLPAPPGHTVRTVAPMLAGSVGGVAVDRLGLIYVANFGEEVYKVTPDGRVSVFATGMYGASGNAIDSKGRLLQSNIYGHSVVRVDRDGTKTTAAEGLAGPVGIAVGPDDSFVVCNCNGNSLSRVAADGTVAPFATSPLFKCPNGIARGPDGTHYVVNYSDSAMLKVSAKGEVTPFAVLPGGGNGHVALAGGDLYATSFQGQRIYRVTLEGDVTLIAGTGKVGEQDGEALAATFSWPNGVAASPAGDRIYVNDWLNRVPPGVVAPPAPVSSLRQITFPTFSAQVATVLATEGLEAMTRFYRRWKTSPARAGAYTELDVNALGYRLLGAGQVANAIEVLRLNVESYPNSANAHDSLGEGYMTAGQSARAIEHYEKSLALNPGNDNAAAMLKKLRSKP